MPPRTQPFVAPSLRSRSADSATMRRVQRLQNLPVATRILGVDPGLHRTGYGVIALAPDANRTPSLQEGGILKARADDALPLRLQSLHDALREVLREHEPEVVVIEELFSTYAHPRSALLMAHARGVLMLAAQEAGAQVHSFLPNEVKQVIAGNGHATKSEMQAAVRARLRLTSMPNPSDVADALALALCFALRQEIGGKLNR